MKAVHIQTLLMEEQDTGCLDRKMGRRYVAKCWYCTTTFNALYRSSSSMVYRYQQLYGRMSHRVWLRVAIASCFMVCLSYSKNRSQAQTQCSDIYGRGYSDAPQTTYNPGLFSTQLALLMQHINWDKAVIVGVSMVCSNIFSHFQSLIHAFRVLSIGWRCSSCVYCAFPAPC